MDEKTISRVTALTMILLMFVFMPKTAYGTAPINISSSGSKVWGTPQFLQENILVNNDDEISKGKAAWVFSFQRDLVTLVRGVDWEAMLSGDMTFIKNEIESKISGVTVRWIQVRWDNAERIVILPYNEVAYNVEGFYVEAIVENINAELTGIEIVAIILAIAFLAVVIGAIVLAVWITHELVLALSQIPPIFQIPIYVILLVLFGVFLLILFGKLSLPDLISALKGKGNKTRNE
jgi:hypothetical protein